jgi:hypothetical protein
MDKFLGTGTGFAVQREKIFVSSWIVVVKQDLGKRRRNYPETVDRVLR